MTPEPKFIRTYYPSGRLSSEARLNHNNEFDGLSRFWYGDGTLQREAMYDNGFVTWSRTYDSSGQVWAESREASNFDMVTKSQGDQ